MSMVTYPLNNIEYTAEDAELFHSTRTSGVYAADSFDYSVTGADNSIVIGTGIAWIKNRQFSGKVVAQKEPMSLDMGLPDPTYPRIDAVVIQFNSNKNATEIVVKNGAASSFPIAPEVVRTESLYELHLYHVRREAGSLSISAPNITDLRNNNAYCGLMSDSITQAVDSTLSKNGVAADAAAVGAALANKAPAGYGYGETLKVIDKSSETDFEASLDAELATMGDKQAKQIAFSCGGDLHEGTTYFGTLTRNISGYAVLYGCSADNAKVFKSMTNGVWSAFEWVNPPMVNGVEYRTTERWNGKAVYTKLVDCGAFPSGGTKKDREIGSGVTKILRAEGTSANSGFTVPYTDNTACVHISATLYQGTALIILYVEKGDLTADSCIAQIWYTKD